MFNNGYIPGMKVLGIDPGSRSTGWGIVVREAGRYRRVGSGAIRTGLEDPDSSAPDRLREIYEGLRSVLALYKPDCAAIEVIFAHKSSISALKLGQARGVALLALAQQEIPIYEYNAMVIKTTVAGTGRAEKEQMERMVGMMLGVELEGPHDEADALAIAITHHVHHWQKLSVAATEALHGRAGRGLAAQERKRTGRAKKPADIAADWTAAVQKAIKERR